jgi:hypothetical protein
VRREAAPRSQSDSVVIDGARIALDTAHAGAVSRDDITEHLARPVRNRTVMAAPVAAPTPAPQPATPPPPPPAPAAVVTMAPTVVQPAVQPAVVEPVAPRRTVRATPKPASTPTVKAPPPTDSAQLVREVAELQRDVAPKLQSVGLALDSVRAQHEANLDRLQRENQSEPDTLKRKMLDQMIAAARWRNDTTSVATKSTPAKKSKKTKALAGS